MWRMDRAYSLLHDDLPALEMLPSEYCRKHFWFTTQPIEEPHRPSDFMRVVGQLDMDDRFLFATDYPHWDFDAPDRAIPASVPKPLRRQMFSGNALALYRGLPRPKGNDI
jgi:predicted TIM-barrel fold metal-dependent hydrolase